jgi:integrase
MPKITLDAKTVQHLKPLDGKLTEYFDTQVSGLVLRVRPTGTKIWCVIYRHRGRLRRLTLGKTSVLSLANARERARDELYRVGRGNDPATEKQSARDVQTVGDLATLYIEKWAKPKKRSWKADDNLLRNKVLPRWRSRAIADIKRQDCIALVEAVADKGAPVVANRVTALLSKMFNFAVDRALIESSPAIRLPRPGAETSRERVLTEAELRTVWHQFEALDPMFCAFFKLRLLTAQRGGEVAAMRWADLDLDGGWWTIPATIAKNKKAHRVPLNASALAIVKALQHDPENPPVGDRHAYVLTGARGKRQQAEAAATFTVPNFVPHDLRRSAASFMAGGGISRLTIKKVLNHVERDITAVYDRHTYDPEKRAALAWWDAKLTAILANHSADVLPFARASA